MRDRDTGQYLQDNLTTWGGGNTINANLASPNATSTDWSLPLTITGNRRLTFYAKTFAVNGSSDGSKAIKKIETFGLADETPTTSVSGPAGSDHPDHHVHRHRHRLRRRRRQLDHAHVP